MGILILAGLVVSCSPKQNNSNHSDTGDVAQAEPLEMFMVPQSITAKTVPQPDMVEMVPVPPAIILRAGSQFTVLDRRQDPMYGEIVRIGIDIDEDDKATPNDIWVEASPELKAATQLTVELMNTFYCYRYVKRYLLSSGLVRSYLPGSYAAQAYSILPRYGFQITGHSPSTATVGEVCVYSGGPKGFGHIEVLRSKGWWYGYGYSRHPIQGRHFLACFEK